MAFPFKDLPLEMQMHVFSYLSRKERSQAASVCTSWKNITNIDLFWKEITVRDEFPCRVDNERFISRYRDLLKNHPTATHLILDSHRENFLILLFHQVSLPSVKTLTLIRCRDMIHLDTLVIACPQIEEFYLDNGQRDWRGVDIPSFSSFLTLTHLTRVFIHINFESVAPDSFLTLMAAICRNLQRVYLFTGNKKYITPASLSDFLHHHEGSLTHLMLNVQTYTPLSLKQIGACSRLRALALWGDTFDPQVDFRPLARLTSLTSLYINCKMNHSSQMEKLWSHIPQVRFLRLDEIYLKPVAQSLFAPLPLRCPRLTILLISQVEGDAETWKPLLQCQQLQQLYLFDIYQETPSVTVTKPFLNDLWAKLPDLFVLKMYAGNRTTAVAHSRPRQTTPYQEEKDPWWTWFSFSDRGTISVYRLFDFFIHY